MKWKLSQHALRDVSVKFDMGGGSAVVFRCTHAVSFNETPASALTLPKPRRLRLAGMDCRVMCRGITLVKDPVARWVDEVLNLFPG